MHGSKDDPNKRKVPTWDGDALKWETFRSKCYWHMRGVTAYNKQHECADIAKQLTGDAWRALEQLTEKQKDDLVEAGDIEKLLVFLKEALLEGQIPEAGRLFNEYVYKFKRNKGESMKMYTQRHRTLLGKLEVAMRTVDRKGRQLLMRS